MVDTRFTYHRHLAAIAAADVAEVTAKDISYGSSWKRREGVGAYMMLARKTDRLDEMMRSIWSYDIFRGIAAVMFDGTQGNDGTVLAEVRDLRRYLLLVEAEMVERGAVPKPPAVVSDAPTYTDFYTRLGVVMGVDRAVAKDRWMAVQWDKSEAPQRPGTPEDGGQHAYSEPDPAMYGDAQPADKLAVEAQRRWDPTAHRDQLERMALDNSKLPQRDSVPVQFVLAEGEPDDTKLVTDRQPRDATTAEFMSMKDRMVTHGPMQGQPWSFLYGSPHADGRWPMHPEHWEQYGK